MKTAIHHVEYMILLALYGKQTTNAWIQIIHYTLSYLLLLLLLLLLAAVTYNQVQPLRINYLAS